jgi:YegS/Rv2252/BmrU family lipid kinase
MHVRVILNPYANRWGARRKMPLVEAALAEGGVRADVAVTSAPGEGIELARRAALEGYDAVVAAGGDGTISEVVNGLIRAAGDAPTRPLGVMPIGTGNDFNDMSGHPRGLAEAVAIIAAGQTRQVDAARVNERYFANNCALAMEPMVTIENVKIKRLAGNSRYLVALVRALIKLKAWQMYVRWDEGEIVGPTLLLSVCNSPRTGGVFLMAPPARMDDGLLDFVYAPAMSRARILTILPRLFSGSHLQHPLVRHGRTRRLLVESSPGTPIHADGEVIAEAETRVEYEILPQKLTLLSSGQPGQMGEVMGK